MQASKRICLACYKSRCIAAAAQRQHQTKRDHLEAAIYEARTEQAKVLARSQAAFEQLLLQLSRTSSKKSSFEKVLSQYSTVVAEDSLLQELRQPVETPCLRCILM